LEEFLVIQEINNRAQRTVDKATGFIKHFASKNPVEKELAIRMMDNLSQSGQLPTDLHP